jgi:hypothetical protein
MTQTPSSKRSQGKLGATHSHLVAKNFLLLLLKNRQCRLISDVYSDIISPFFSFYFTTLLLRTLKWEMTQTKKRGKIKQDLWVVTLIKPRVKSPRQKWPTTTAPPYCNNICRLLYFFSRPRVIINDLYSHPCQHDTPKNKNRQPPKCCQLMTRHLLKLFYIFFD